ncbi:MAG TPA: 50S ribosomal protein L29 [Candidatus Marinimicrobia bacterium]|jgi:large subunit ribosomal protein L29|nr:50S ribosomal protein L29 [Candidatus Neomarinimicrobiota bacterium]MDP6275450.1 50S ribosomal protein L29 [Candidatus Neomarinimicrobiota bacterium]MDP7217085.1 50S ribosomal protein L29 [Candidatus Neomarinimicrobiota bacterium]HJL75202.1 50S ribosomal protein L29 [Candidatus Neomarinimicrobiota bacterium]HJM70497.1 50S ribosomal protein L29 [Candidatus Neomarinimicrobiota bacterium]|tara:strand:- start:11240 stop:11455 length:216 start_codon:yes stop_codon:yes gene_type:complete
MKRTELNEMTSSELDVKLQENMEALQNIRFQKSLQQLENPLQIKYLKKEVAQIKTVLHEFELGVREEKGQK